MRSTKYYSQYLRRAGALPPPGTLLCTLYNGGGRPLPGREEQFLVEGADWGGGERGEFLENIDCGGLTFYTRNTRGMRSQF